MRVSALTVFTILTALSVHPVIAQDAIISRIEIQRQDVFAPNERGFLPRAANALHVETRDWVIRRELLLQPGELWDSVRAAESERNLRALDLFGRVQIDTVRAGDSLIVRVMTRDGWSIRPEISYERAGDQVAWSLGLTESNLIGRGGVATIDYENDPDRTSWLVSWRQPRLIANRVNLAALLEDRSDGLVAYGALTQPFFSFSSRWAASMSGTSIDGDVLRFRGGDPVPVAVLRRRYALFFLEGAHALEASPRGYLRVGLRGQVRRDDFVPAPPTGSVPRTVTGAIGGTLSWSRANFAVLHNVRSFLREEDQNLSPTLTVGVFAAPTAFGYDEGGVGLSASGFIGTRIPSGVARLSASASGLFAGGALDSGTVRVRGEMVLQPHARHTLLLTANGGWQRDPVPGAEFDYGFGVGLRSYPLHAYTGDRSFLLGAEYRWTLADDWRGLLGIALGAFGAYGGAWFEGDPRRTGTEFGGGVRVGSSRLADADLFRLDIAYRAANDRLPSGWSLVIGQGFPF